MRVAVIGKSGQLARCLAETAPEGMAPVFFGRGELDLAAASPDLSALAAYSPQLVINAAAYTAVDQAEADRDGAFALNARGPGLLGGCCAELQAPLIHISTDYVFDGRATRPYAETDDTAPLNVYGESKLAGEHAVAAALARHIVIRTSWLYSPFGGNFVKTMLRLADTRDSLTIVADQFGRPTSASDLAAAVWTIADRLASDAEAGDCWGTYHFAGAGSTSWAEFAEAIFAWRRGGGARVPHIERIASQSYPTPAVRPLYSVLDTGRIEAAFGLQPPHWRDSLETVLSRLSAEAGQ